MEQRTAIRPASPAKCQLFPQQLGLLEPTLLFSSFLFAAPALNVSIGRSDEELADPGFYGAELTNDSSDETVAIWPGLSLGARFF